MNQSASSQKGIGLCAERGEVQIRRCSEERMGMSRAVLCGEKLCCERGCGHGDMAGISGKYIEN